MTARPDALTRFWSRADKDGPTPAARPELGPCWLWTGALFKRSGYGRFNHGGRDYVAHRWIYERVREAVEDELQLDHLCRNRACVNYEAHLEPVTPQVNVLRNGGITAANAAKTHCNRGHPLSGPNLFVRMDGRRRCRTCERATQKRLRSTPEYRSRHAAEERRRKALRRSQAA